MRRTLLSARSDAVARPLRVLLVDDEAPIRRLLAALLRRSVPGGVAVREATSGEDALLALGDAEFDLVVSDFRMGAVNGVDVLESAAARCPGAARVLVTGYADVPVAVDGVNRGQMDGFVPKPWDNDRLVTVILRAVERTGPRRRSGPSAAPGGFKSRGDAIG